MTASTDYVVAPLTPAVGGLVSGLDLSRPPSERAVQGLREALAERHVLFFENQTLEPAAQRDFASRFGKLHVHPVYRHVEGVPEITLIETRRDSLPDNDNWHTDVTFIETPPFGAVLTPKVLPSSGGDTLWSSTVAAYNALSEPVRRLVDGLTAEHDFQHGFKRHLWGVGDLREAWEKAVAANPPVVHPVVRTLEERQAGVHRALALEARRRGLLGQSPEHALRDARLSAAQPDDDPCRDSRRPPTLMTRGASGPARDGDVTSRK